MIRRERRRQTKEAKGAGKGDKAADHGLRGEQLAAKGNIDEAIKAFRRAISIDPHNANAHYNLGVLLGMRGQLDEAIESYLRATVIQPENAIAHNNLGNAFKDLGRLEDAAASYRKAIDVKPDHAGGHYNLGLALQALGQLDDALASFRKALAIDADYAQAHNNLGAVLQNLGRLDDAAASYRKAIAIEPHYFMAHNNLAKVCLDLGRYGEVMAACDQVLWLKHGGPWWNAATFADGDRAGEVSLAEAPRTSIFKLRDTADQLEYLIGKGRIDSSFERMIELYRAVLIEIQQSEGPEADTQLTPDQFEHLGSFHNRVVHYADAPRIDTGVVNPSLDFGRIEDSYLSSPVSITTLDGFLTPEALRTLRDFCLESTIYFDYIGNRFVSSWIDSGFNCDILYQIAEELKEYLPRVLGGHALNNIWVYRYNNQSEGVGAHTDNAAVSFNFWITPDAANQKPDRGGLIFYAKEQPYDWDWQYYNAGKYTPAVSREVADFLANAETITIPYRNNRAALFHSNRFHKSDQVCFQDGYENRRMNVTMLFGKRSASLNNP